MAKKLAAFFKKASGLFSSALTYLILFALCGASLVSSGVFVIFGLGPALISAGVFFLLYMLVIYRGIGNG